MATAVTKVLTAELMDLEEMQFIDGVSPLVRYLRCTNTASEIKTGLGAFYAAGIIQGFGLIGGLGSSFEAGMWIRPNEITATSYLFTIYEDDGGGGYDAVAYVRTDLAKKIGLWLPTSGGVGSRVVTEVDSAGINSTGLQRLGKWHHVGIFYSGTSVKFWINGNLLFDWSGSLTYGFDALAPLRVLGIGAQDRYLVDDFYFATGIGGTNPPEAKRFFGVRPTSDSAVTFTPNSGGTNYTQVDETGVPDNATTYVSAASDVGDELYGHPAVALPANHVTDIGIAGFAVRGGSFGAEATYIPANFLVELSASKTEGSAAAGGVQDEWDFAGYLLSTKPGGGAWTESDFDTMTFGVRTNAAVSY